MILMGASAGSATIVISTLWVELYGINYIGSIRSMFFSMVVLATSISPAFIGLLLDMGVTLETQFIIFAIYIFICSIIFAILTPNLLIARSLHKVCLALSNSNRYYFLNSLKTKKVRIPDTIPGATS